MIPSKAIDQSLVYFPKLVMLVHSTVLLSVTYPEATKWVFLKYVHRYINYQPMSLNNNAH